MIFYCNFHDQNIYIEEEPNPAFKNQYCNNSCEHKCKFNKVRVKIKW